MEQFFTDADLAALEQSQGIPVFTDEDLAKKEAELKKFDRPVEAFVQGAARAGTFGVSDVLQTQTGFRTPEELRKIKEVSPWASGAGEVTGIVAPLVASGGTSLLAKGAATAGKGVLGAAKLGELTTAAAAKQFASEAAKSTAREIMEKAASRGLGTAVEGALYGAGQVVSESALGDTDLTAEKIASTIGMSALIGGGLTSTLSVVGKGIKEAAKATRPAVSKVLEGISGISPHSRKILLEKSDDLNVIASKGASAEEALSNHVGAKALDWNESRYNFVTKLTDQIDDVLKDPKLGLASREIKPFLETLEAAKNKILPEGTVAMTPEVKTFLDKINEISSNFVKQGLDNAGAKADEIFDLSTLKITGRQLNSMKRQFQNSLKFNKQIGVETPLDKLYDDLQFLSNGELALIDPRIKKFNHELHTSLSAQKKLKSYGLNDRGDFDPAKLKKLVGLKDSAWTEVKKDLQVLDAKWGTDFVETVELSRAFRELSPKDVFSRSYTGRSLLVPGLSAAAGSLVGGLPGAAVGALVGEALQSPMATKALVRAQNAIENQIDGKLVPLLRQFEGNNLKNVPSHLVPYVSAQLAGLQVLKREQEKSEKQLTEGVKAFLENRKVPYQGPQPEKKTYDERMAKLTELVTNPDKFIEATTQASRPMALVAPKMAESLQRQMTRAYQYLYDKAPKAPAVQNPFFEQKFKPTDTELAKWNRRIEAAENPLTVVHDLQRGKLTPETVETIKVVYPKYFEEIRNQLLTHATDGKSKVAYQRRLQLSLLFDAPIDSVMRPEFVQQMQATFTQPENLPGAGLGSHNLNMASAQMSQSQKIESR